MQKLFFVKSDDLSVINQNLLNGAKIVNISPIVGPKGEIGAFVALESKNTIL